MKDQPQFKITSQIGNVKIANFKLQISKRRGWDSNPRYSFPYTAFPVLPVKPLLHLSGKNAKGKGPGRSLHLALCSLLFAFTGGEGGIRTHGTLTGTTVFETARFNRSRTSPHVVGLPGTAGAPPASVQHGQLC